MKNGLNEILQKIEEIEIKLNNSNIEIFENLRSLGSLKKLVKIMIKEDGIKQ